MRIALAVGVACGLALVNAGGCGPAPPLQDPPPASVTMLYGGSALGILAVLPSSDPAHPGDLAARTFSMGSLFTGQVGAPLDLPEDAPVVFPGYTGACRADAPASAIRREHYRLQEEFVDRDFIHDPPFIYAKLVGQQEGSVGVLYMDGGLGWPRAAYTPPSIICHSWKRLRELLERHPDGLAAGVRKVYVQRGTEVHSGQYAVTGFTDAEVEQWEREVRAEPPK